VTETNPGGVNGKDGSGSPAAETRVLTASRDGEQALLQSSEQRFQLLVQSIRDYAIFMLHPDGTVASWNEGAQRIKGYEADEIIGRSFELFYTPADRAAGIPSQVLEAARSARSYQTEGWRVRKDGTAFWGEVTITALRESGELIGFAKVTRDLTERRSAEAAQREGEERFRQLTENAREVFWLTNAEFTRTLFVSSAFEDVWGEPADRILANARVWLELVHPDDRQVAEQLVVELQERRRTVSLRIVRRDGTLRWLRVRGFPIRDEDGRTIRIGGVTEDITAQREAEERVRFLAEAGRELTSSLDYEETLRNVARLAVPGVADWCVVDVLADGRIHRLGVLHKDAAKEELALDVARRYPPEPSAPHGVAQVMRTGTPQVVPELTDEELRLVAKDKEHFRLLRQLGLRSFMILPMIARGRTLGTITLIAAESGRRFSEDDLPFAEELAGRAALAVDNARLYREADAARAEAERRAREEAALRQATEAVTATFSIDEVIRLIAASSLEATNADGAFVKRIDLPSDEVEVVAVSGTGVPSIGSRTPYGGSFTAAVVESGEPLVVSDLSQPNAGINDLVMLACGRCSAMVVPLIDAGEAIGALVLTRGPDRPGFAGGEVQRARTFADLASLAFRKIHLLRESEQRREELEEVMESRARLLRGFSHDLKNPLGAADGYLELIESGVISEPEKQELSISRARRSILSAVSLINDLTELARTESGRIEVRSEPVDVREIARELTEEYRAQAEGKGLDISYDVPDRLAVTDSDSTRIRQVLGNLVSNAVKYTETGSITITVAERRGSEAPREGSWIAISVADTGIGIPREKHGLLFREFMRLMPAVSTGAGLGLAISQRVADALSGCVTLESEPGRGSVFTLWIPLRSGER
jgi:PAS domain S-box-containing protein